MMPPIPPTLIWTVGIVGAAMLVKTVMKQRNRVNAELERVRAAKQTGHEPVRKLRRDPRTGVYRP